MCVCHVTENLEIQQSYPKWVWYVDGHDGIHYLMLRVWTYRHTWSKLLICFVECNTKGVLCDNLGCVYFRVVSRKCGVDLKKYSWCKIEHCSGAHNECVHCMWRTWAKSILIDCLLWGLKVSRCWLWFLCLPNCSLHHKEVLLGSHQGKLCCVGGLLATAIELVWSFPLLDM